MPIDLAPSELSMWERPTKARDPKPSDDEINSKYGTRELRVVTESNREQLPNFVEALRRHRSMKLRPSLRFRGIKAITFPVHDPSACAPVAQRI